MILKEQAFNNIKNACEKRICEVYPAGVPNFAREELDWELDKLKKSEYVFDFELFRLVSEAAKRGAFPVVNINTYMIGYLLGYMTLNPLKVHYYCPECGKYEVEDPSLTEFEIPDKKCECGCDYKKYGMNVQRVFIWGLDSSNKNPGMTIRCCEEMIPFARNAIVKEFDDDLLKYIAASLLSEDQNGNSKRESSCHGFAIVPAEFKSDMPSICVKIGKHDFENTVQLNDVYKNNMFRVSCMKSNLLSEIYKMQQETGIYTDEIIPDYSLDIKDVCEGKCNKFIADVNKIYQTIKPDSFSRLAELFAMDRNTYSDYNKFTEFKEDEGVRTKSDYRKNLSARYERFLTAEYPIAFREDAYYHLEKVGVLGEDLEKAYVMFNKGMHIRKVDKFNEVIDKYNIPKQLREELDLCLYCFPKSACYGFVRCFSFIAEYLRIMKKK